MLSSEFHTSRRIGDVTVTIISDGSCLWAPRFSVPDAAWRRAAPDADAEGRIRIGFNIAHIRAGDASIMVDPGFDDPGSSWNAAFGARWPGYTRTPGMSAALAAIGVRPEEVTHVLITHAHDDHFAGVAVERDGRHDVRFPHARHLIGRRDWDGNPRRGDLASELTIRLGAVENVGLLDPVDGELEVTPGVWIIPAAGETSGHCIVRVRSGAETFYYVGDLFHHASEIVHPDWVPPHRDAFAMRASRGRFLEEASSSRATVVFTHAPHPAWGFIVRAANGFLWQASP